MEAETQEAIDQAKPGEVVPATTEEAIEAAAKRRTTAEIAVETIQRCRYADLPDLAEQLVKESKGLALDLRIALDRRLQRG